MDDAYDKMIKAMLADGPEQTKLSLKDEPVKVDPMQVIGFEPQPIPDDFDISKYPFKGTYEPHQARALAEANLKPGHCFFVDAGGGKTGIVIGEASLLYEMGEIDALIALAPNGPHEQIVDQQLPLWADVPWRGFHNRMKKKQIDAFFDRANHDVMAVMAMNYETLITPNGRKLLDRFIARFPRFYLALDESSKLKDLRSRRTHEATMLARRARYRRVMSGTPLLKGVEDLYAQYDMIEQGVTGVFNYASFKAYYCVQQPIYEAIRRKPGEKVTPEQAEKAPKKIVGYRNQDELKRKVAPVTTRVRSSEFRPDANPLFIPVSTPMTPPQAAIYNSMLKDLIAEIDGKVITVENAISRMTKLLQIGAGFIFDEDRNVKWINDNKVAAVMDKMDELDEPVIVFAPFIPLQDRIEEMLRARRDRPVHRYRTPADVRAWKESGNGIIVGNQSSGLGIGQNLQMAAATIYASNLFSSEARWQSIARTDRMGQDRQCRFWDLVTPGTMEPKVLDRLKRNEDLANATINDIRSFLCQH